MSSLILKRAPIGWNQDDYDVLENGVVVGRICKEEAAPPGRRWGWASGHNGDIKRARDGYEATREAAMAAFRGTGEHRGERPRWADKERQGGPLPA